MMKSFKKTLGRFVFLIIFLSPFISLAQEAEKNKPTPSPNEAAELAKKLANPIASLISVPFQNNTFYGIGSLKGTQNVMNFQPVIPFKISDNLNLITRYIIPIVTQYEVTGEN